MNTPAILLVDDEKPILRALERELSNLADEISLEIKSFTNPLVALSYIKEYPEKTAVLISDQRMAELKGCDFIGKAKEINDRIVPILLTAYTDTDDIINTIRTGIFSFILKPWNRDDLEREVRKAFHRYKNENAYRTSAEQLRVEFIGGGLTQEKFLAPRFEKDDRFSFSVNYKPQLSCGGDYYDLIRINEDNYLIAIGDVSGHGIKAAFITFILKTITNEATFSRLLNTDVSLSRIMAYLNHRVSQVISSIQPLFISFCLCHMNLRDRTMTVSNGGHMPPLIIRDGKLLEMESQGTAMGFLTDIAYSDSRLSLRDKDRIVLYTDGLSELDGGISRLKEIFLFYKDNPYFVSAVMEDIKRLQTNEEIKDDMTLISLEMNL